MNACRGLGTLNLEPYRGQTTELVIGIDVGLTFSGVCYAFLRPGEVPEVQTVTRFTDQVFSNGKVPSVIYYDENSTMRAAGASTTLYSVVEEAQYEHWVDARFFKMHMKQPSVVVDTHGLKLDALPPPKTATEVMADFLRYLYSETLTHIDNHHADGDELLERVSKHTKFVLSLPNGWSGLPQQYMREAAVKGGLVEDNAEARTKVSFVSEGEASALSCLAGGLCPSKLDRGYRFIIADLGGGTLDVTSYEVTQSSPIRLKELTSSDCRFAGSVFVNMKARELLQAKLRGTQYDNPEILDEIVEDEFENSTKRGFSDATKISWLRVGERSENDPELGIRRGFLRLDGKEVASCFDHSISEAHNAIKAQIVACGGKAMPVWIVGGLAESAWVFKRLSVELQRYGSAIKTPCANLSKAVAHGNVLYNLEHPVTNRVTRRTFGIDCDTHYQWSDPDHRRRSKLKLINLSGDERLPGKFDVLVCKDTEVRETQIFSRHYHRHIRGTENATFRCTLLITDEDDPPAWYDENKDKFERHCRIEADLSRLYRWSRFREHAGNTFCLLHFDVEIVFGSTELQARIKWAEDGKEKFGPALIFYE